ncbi:MAG: BACON domain-containing protein, partial [Bacteroidales bacterium]|nr:BACON domain-containing protein [Bacteroidales bacterium]
MKKYIFLFLSIALMMGACQKDEEPYVRFNTTEVTMSDVGGEETITFETNASWIASTSESWCSVTPSRGGQSSERTTIRLSANNGYEARTCELTIMAGDVSETITITQSQKDAIVITNKNIELPSDADTLVVRLKANVEVEVIIADDAKGWVSTPATSRAMKDEAVTLYIAENKETGGTRRAAVYIKDKASDVQDVLTIVQRGVTVLPPGTQIIEGDASRVQHLDLLSRDFV